MEIDSNLKNVIKYYLKAKDNIKNKKKYLYFLEKTIINLNKINSEELDEKLKIYVNSIKDYSTTNLINVVNELLVKNIKPAKDSIFNQIDEGNLNSITESENGCEYTIFNSEGLTPLHRCIKMGDTTILKELLKKGGKVDTVNKQGNTLLEYACLQNDPNLIVFLLEHGSDMKKHLYFRSDVKLKLKIDDIDIANLIKICLLKGKTEISPKKTDISFLYDFIKNDFQIGVNDFKFEDFYLFLSNFVNSLSEESQNTIIEIWKEELSFELKNKMGCQNNYLEVILLNLVPFIDYPFNITNRDVLTFELINLIKFLNLKNNYLIDLKFNKNLVNRIWKDYNGKLPYDYIGIILSNIFDKIRK